MIPATTERAIVISLVLCLACWANPSHTAQPPSADSAANQEPAPTSPNRKTSVADELRTSRKGKGKHKDCGHQGKEPRADHNAKKKDGKTFTAAKSDRALASAARFSCAQPEIKIPPLWVDQPIKATWLVKNEGTANLVLKLKGG